MRLGLVSVALLLWIAWGCKKDPTTDSGSASTGNVTGGKPDDANQKSALDTSKIPAELKSEGYDYYGLSSLDPVEEQMTSRGRVLTGTRITRLVKIAAGKAIFEVEYTGGLTQLGVSTYSVEKDGVYADKISMGTFKPGHQLEIPAELKPGATWGKPVNLTLTTGDKLMTNLVYRVVGPQRVKTKAGVFDSILVVAKGTESRGGEKLAESMKLWFAKGVGAVKIEMAETKGKTTTASTIEATKVGK